MSQQNDCLKRLEAVVDALIAEGADPGLVAGALGQTAIYAAKRDPKNAPMYLETVADILTTVAQAERGIQSIESLQQALRRKRARRPPATSTAETASA